MRLTIIAPDNVYEHEVDPGMEVQDIKALVEAETGMPADIFALSTDSGVDLSDASRTLESYNLTGANTTIFLTISPQASSSSQSSTSATGLPDSSEELETMRLQALGNPQLMTQLRQTAPNLAQAIQSGGPGFRSAYEEHKRKTEQAQAIKQSQVALLNADPYDVDAQRKIEEAIRLELVQANMEHAMEYSPEAFGSVHMLYINVEVNGHPVKAFVDSGAQSTIMSPELAEKCGIMRLLDTRFAGMAQGVGTARILGRIHSAQIKLGTLHLPCSFTILEGKAVPLLFGLDMLKRHQCCIDLSTNTLRINSTEVPFLAEHELPDEARMEQEAGLAEELAQAAGEGIPAVVPSPETRKRPFPGEGNTLGAPFGASSARASTSSAPQASASASGGGGRTQFPESAISTLVGLGASREQAIQLLEVNSGNVDMAASMLFS